VDDGFSPCVLLEMQSPGDIGPLVRNWLHYDGLASSFYRQSTRARQVRDDFETQIIANLRSNKMENAVIQIGGGHITLAEERNSRQLTLPRIEELLRGYYGRRGGKDETTDIMAFIKSNREVDTVVKLKKSTAVGQQLPPLPTPPPMGGGGTGAAPAPAAAGAGAGPLVIKRT
jgi:hypothetical protein